MVSDYQIQPNSRRCVVTGRELQPGERYYSALVEEGPHFQRKDFCQEAWQGPPAGAFSFWTGRVPEGQGPSRPPVDDDLLEECFARLEGQTDPRRVNFRYVVALLLVRRKRFKLEGSGHADAQDTLILREARTGVQHEIIHPPLTEDEMQEAQDEVFQVLGWK